MCYFRHRPQWPTLTSGNGNLVCYCEMKRMLKLFPETNAIEETTSKYATLLKEWGSTGMEVFVRYLLSCTLKLITLIAFTLCSELYGKVVVASKVPLPNYRPDLDDKRPQREVIGFS